MWEIGKTINKMELDNNLGQIKRFIKVSIKMEKNTEKESSCGLMIVHMKDNSSKIISTGKVGTNGKMGGYI
jgi:hypothetical protein